jgi:hypothetical protein
MKRIVFILCIYCLIPSLKGQNDKQNFGLLLEYGIVGHKLDENLNYRPLIIGGVYSFQLAKFNEKNVLRFNLIPLFGLAFNKETNFEFGLNGRLEWQRKISQKSSLTFKIGSGPYWIDVETTRQRNGFIFSDYFILGWLIEQKNKALEIYISYRHLSNLSIKKPNGGINNSIAGIIAYF